MTRSEERDRSEAPLTRDAQIASSTLDAKSGTVEVTFSTGAAVKRYDWRRDEYYWEELEISESAINWARLNDGAPVLDSHAAHEGIRGVLGVVTPNTARVAGPNDARAQLRFDLKDESARAVFGKMERGFVTKVSVGYSVEKIERQTELRDNLPVYRATRWTPYEISPVSMPADAGAKVRTMDQEDTKPVVETRVAPAPAPAPAVEAAPPVPAVVTPVAPAVDVRAAVEQERARILEIGSHCRNLKLPEEFSADLVARNVSISEARGLILAEAGKRQGPLPSAVPATIAVDEADKQREVSELALSARLHVGVGDKRSQELLGLTDEQYRAAKQNETTATPVKLARSSLLRAGVSYRELESLTNHDIVERAMGIGIKYRTHSTSDFPNLLESGVRRTLRAYYASVPQQFKMFSQKDNAPDFRSRTIVNVSGLGMPQKTPQGDKYKRTTFAEGTESWKIEHEGVIIGFTLQALANDDLGAIRNVPQQLGLAAARAESRDFYQHLVSNPTMGDGVVLFHASRTNTAAGGSLATDAALQVAYQWMWTRKDAMLNPIQGRPGFLLVPAALKIAANKLFNAQVTPDTLANSIALRTPGIERPEIVADPYLDIYGTATGHYLIAATDVGPAFAYGYLDGSEGPQVSSATNFETGGIDFKLVANFGVKALDANLVYQLT